MTPKAERIIRAHYALQAFVAKDRGELLREDNCGYVEEDKWKAQDAREDILSILGLSIVTSYQPSTASITFSWEGDPDAELTFTIGGDSAAVETANDYADKETFFDQVVTEIKAWLNTNKHLGTAYHEGDTLYVVAMLDNDTDFDVSIGTPAGTGSISVKAQEDFSGRVGFGCISSHCEDGNEGLDKAYIAFQRKYVDGGYCDDPIRSVSTDHCPDESGYGLTASVDLVAGVFQLTATSNHPMAKGQFGWNLTIYDNAGEYVTDYPLEGDASDFPATHDPQL